MARSKGKADVGVTLHEKLLGALEILFVAVKEGCSFDPALQPPRGVHSEVRQAATELCTVIQRIGSGSDPILSKDLDEADDAIREGLKRHGLDRQWVVNQLRFYAGEGEISSDPDISLQVETQRKMLAFFSFWLRRTKQLIRSYNQSQPD